MGLGRGCRLGPGDHAKALVSHTHSPAAGNNNRYKRAEIFVYCKKNPTKID